MKNRFFLAAALAVFAATAPQQARAACVPEPTGLGLGITQLGDRAKVWFNCFNDNFLLLNSSAAVQAAITERHVVSSNCSAEVPLFIGALCFETSSAKLFVATDTIAGAFLESGSGGSGGAIPIGGILPWTSTAIPSGYAIADGTLLSTGTFSALHGVIGYDFGGSSVTGMFALPDLRNRFVVGHSTFNTRWDVVGETGGTETHDHGGNTGNFTSVDTHAANDGSNWEIPENHAHPISTDDNLPPYFSLIYLIRTGFTQDNEPEFAVWESATFGFQTSTFVPSIGISSDPAPGQLFTVGERLFNVSTGGIVGISSVPAPGVILAAADNGFRVTDSGAVGIFRDPLPGLSFWAGDGELPAMLIGQSNGVAISSIPLGGDSLLIVGTSFFHVTEAGQALLGEAVRDEPFAQGDPILAIGGNVAIGKDAANGGTLTFTNEAAPGQGYSLLKDAEGAFTIQDGSGVALVSISTPDYHATFKGSATVQALDVTSNTAAGGSITAASNIVGASITANGSFIGYADGLFDYNRIATTETLHVSSINVTSYIGIATTTVVLRGNRPVLFLISSIARNGNNTPHSYDAAIALDGVPVSTIEGITIVNNSSDLAFERHSVNLGTLGSGSKVFSLWVKSDSTDLDQVIRSVRFTVIEL